MFELLLRPSRNLNQVEYATLEYVDWFNHRRLLEPIENIPAEKEANHYREHTPAPLAGLKQTLSGRLGTVQGTPSPRRLVPRDG